MNKTQKFDYRSQMKQPFKLLGEMFNDIWVGRQLAYQLFKRDIKARYRQSFLGYVWAFLPPIAMTIPFVLLNKNGLFNVGDVKIPYPAYAMIGTILWQVFVDSINSPLRKMQAAKPMLAKINFPRESLLVAGILEVFFDFTIRLVLLFFVFWYFKLELPSTMFMAPVGILAIILLGFMIGILLIPIGVLYNDITQLLTLFMGFWLLLTPVVYPPQKEGILSLLTEYNPVSPLIIATRNWLTVGSATNITEFTFVLIVTFGLLFIGWFVFRISLPHLIARTGS